MREIFDDVNETEESDETEVERSEITECESEKRTDLHFASTYQLKPNEQYEVNHYNYETDRYGRIKRCEGTLRLEDGKRNLDHQAKAGGEYRMETDEGGHLIATRFGGSEKIDNIVPMDIHVNRAEYKVIENEWASELKKGNQVDVRVSCKYEESSARPTAFVVKYRVTEQDGSTRIEMKTIENMKHGGKSDE